jgi:Homeodomain
VATCKTWLSLVKAETRALTRCKPLWRESAVALQLTVLLTFPHNPLDALPIHFSSIYSNISIRMRPPTRSTRSTRLPSNKPTTNARGSRTSDPLNPAPLQPIASATTTAQPKQPQSVVSGAATVDTSTSLGDSDLSPKPPVLGYCSVLSTPPTKFVFENQKLELEHQSQAQAQAQTSPAGSNALGKPPRSRHRMTSEKLETLDAFFRRNTHPSRKEKEAICKDLDM